MVMLVIIGVAVLAVAVVIWSDVAQREDDDIDPEMEERVSRYEILAAAASDLRVELGREPSVREIYAAVEADEPEADQVVDLRTRVDRVVGDLASPLAE